MEIKLDQDWRSSPVDVPHNPHQKKSGWIKIADHCPRMYSSKVRMDQDCRSLPGNGWMALADLGDVPCSRPPMGPNPFVFAYIFAKKYLRQRSTPPPPQQVHAPLREILDPPLDEYPADSCAINPTAFLLQLASKSCDASYRCAMQIVLYGAKSNGQEPESANRY